MCLLRLTLHRLHIEYRISVLLLLSSGGGHPFEKGYMIYLIPGQIHHQAMIPVRPCNSNLSIELEINGPHQMEWNRREGWGTRS